MWKIHPIKYLSNVDNVSHFPLIKNPIYGMKITQKSKDIFPSENDYLKSYISNIETTFDKNIKIKKETFLERIYEHNTFTFKIKEFKGETKRELYIKHELPRFEFEQKIGMDANIYYIPKRKGKTNYYEIITPDELNSRRIELKDKFDFIDDLLEDSNITYSTIIDHIQLNYNEIQSKKITQYSLEDENNNELCALFWGFEKNEPEIIYLNRNIPTKAEMISHNKRAIEFQKSFKECIFISVSTLKKLIKTANRNHPFESSCELKFFKNYYIQQKSWKLFGNIFGYKYPKPNRKIIGKILFENVGTPDQVEGVEAMKVTESGETYNTEEIYTIYDVDFHTHVFPLKSIEFVSLTLSDADKGKTSSIYGGGLLLNYPYSLDYLIAWSRYGYGKNVIVCDDKENVII